MFLKKYNYSSSEMFLSNYLSLLIFFIFSLGLSSVIIGLSVLLTSKQDDFQKLSAYECGFNPFDDSRSEFEVKFYLVAILFLIFDLEISFLFPFVTCFDAIGWTGLIAMLIFLIVLTVGFVYEWNKGDRKSVV